MSQIMQKIEIVFIFFKERKCAWKICFSFDYGLKYAADVFLTGYMRFAMFVLAEVYCNLLARPPRWDERAQADKSPLTAAFSLSSHLGIGCNTLGAHYVSIWSIYIFLSFGAKTAFQANRCADGFDVPRRDFVRGSCNFKIDVSQWGAIYQSVRHGNVFFIWWKVHWMFL